MELVQQPSARLFVNIKILAADLESPHQIFFSEDGITAIILGEKDGTTFIVKLSQEEYATAGGKMFWVREPLTVGKES